LVLTVTITSLMVGNRSVSDASKFPDQQVGNTGH